MNSDGPDEKRVNDVNVKVMWQDATVDIWGGDGWACASSGSWNYDVMRQRLWDANPGLISNAPAFI